MACCERELQVVQPGCDNFNNLQESCQLNSELENTIAKQLQAKKLSDGPQFLTASKYRIRYHWSQENIHGNNAKVEKQEGRTTVAKTKSVHKSSDVA